MNDRSDTSHRRRPFPPAVVVVLALALMLAACAGQDEPQTRGAGDPAPPQAAEQARSILSEEIADRREQVMAGSHLTIPAIGVSTPLINLGLNEDHTMEVPSDFDLAGWYRYSPTPGEAGPAVIAGHVDSHTGPAVFYRLTDLQPGDEVQVGKADGTTETFTVDRVEQHPKHAFPHEDVYGDTDDSQLRLITCGGIFDQAENAHRDNIIVYASG